ncbi:MAG: hypothetical protein GYA23_09965 [Methanomicrobiales archaeon]|nr:hypothetical protein [Methanomicrobiales archaeon]
MSRGPRSPRALAAALPVAQVRGELMLLEKRPGTCFDFLVSGPATTSVIRVDRALRIHGTPAEIASGFSDTISRISAASLAPDISRELWLWSPWGTMRYFRIEGVDITELDPLGNVRMPLVKGACAGAGQFRHKTSRKKTGCPTFPLQPSGPAPDTGVAMIPQPSGIASAAPGPATGSGTEPAPIRYLKHRAKEMLKETGQKKTGIVSGSVPASDTCGSIASGGESDPPSQGSLPGEG